MAKKKLTQDDWIIIVTLGIGTPIGMMFLLLIGDSISKDRQKVIDNGIETIGIVIDKCYGGRPRHHTIDYKFVVDSILFYSTENINGSAYDTIKIGSKYKVKYLPENPNRNDNVYIFIDQPIKDNEAEW